MKRVRDAQWYVIQVLGGHEDRACRLIEASCREMQDRAGNPLLDEVFCPRYATRRKYQGVWRDVERKLLPGYVIAVTAEPRALRERLRSVNDLTRMLQLGGDVAPLQKSERAWLEESTKIGARTVLLSVAVKDGQKITVTRGPLMGKEAQIIRINRHKCTATLELHAAGKRITTQVGLAVLNKDLDRTEEDIGDCRHSGTNASHG